MDYLSPIEDSDRFSPLAKKTLVICAVASVVALTFARLSFSLLQTAINDDLLRSNTLSGSAGAAGLTGYLVGVASVSVLASRFEPIAMLRTGMAVCVVMLAILGVAPNALVLITALAILGFASAAIWIPLPTIASTPAPASRRGLVMGIMSSSMGLGLLIMSQVTNLARSWAGDQNLWRQIWMVEAAYAAIALVLVVLVLDAPPSAPQADGKAVNGLTALRTLPGWSLAAASFVTYGFTVMAASQFFGAALEEMADFSRSHTSNIYALIGLAAIPGATVLGRLSDRFGRAEMMTAAMVLSTTATALVLLAAEPWASVAAVLFGIGTFGFPIIVAAYVADHLQARTFSAAFGALTVMMGVGQLLGPQISGIIADSAGFRVVFVLITAMAIVSGILAAMLARSDRARASAAAS